MILPNPAMDFDPLDVLTAAELDDLVENDQAIASGLNDGTALTSIRKNNLTIDSNPYKFRAYRNAALNTANGSSAKIAYDTENYDSNNNFATGTYTAPVAGFYQFNAGATVASGGLLQGAIFLFKNGAAHTNGGNNTPQSGNGFSCTVSDVVQLAASDTVEIYWYSSTTAGFTTGSASVYFGGYLISRT